MHVRENMGNIQWFHVKVKGTLPSSNIQIQNLC
jgi:hypothetical protein